MQEGPATTYGPAEYPVRTPSGETIGYVESYNDEGALTAAADEYGPCYASTEGSTTVIILDAK